MKKTRFFWICLLALLLTAGPAFSAKHTVGFGVGSVPDYEGSDDSDAVPMLLLKGNYDSGRSFALVGTNMKVNLVPSKVYSFGPALNYRMGRDDVDNKTVDRMKDLDAAFEVGVFGGVDISNWLLELELLADVSDEHDGMTVQATAGYRWKASEGLTITPGIFSTYADNDYMDAYFGVNDKNRGTSGLPDYKANSDIKDVGAKVVVHYAPWEKWGVMALLSYTALLNDAKDSPIVDEGDDNQVLLGLMATYRWGSN